MKKIVLIALGLLVAAFAVIAVVAPKSIDIEREVVISKPLAVVFADLKMMRTHDSWSPWMKKDPNVKKEYKGEDGTVGFVSMWSGNDQVGTGEQEIKSIAEGSRIDYELRFKSPMESLSSAFLITEAVDATSTKVKWGFHSPTPFPMNVLCFLMKLDRALEAELDSGLQMLKSRLEN